MIEKAGEELLVPLATSALFHLYMGEEAVVIPDLKAVVRLVPLGKAADALEYRRRGRDSLHQAQPGGDAADALHQAVGRPLDDEAALLLRLEPVDVFAP